MIDDTEEAIATVENYLFTSKARSSFKTAVSLLISDLRRLQAQNKKLRERLKTLHTGGEK